MPPKRKQTISTEEPSKKPKTSADVSQSNVKGTKTTTKRVTRSITDANNDLHTRKIRSSRTTGALVTSEPSRKAAAKSTPDDTKDSGVAKSSDKREVQAEKSTVAPTISSSKIMSKASAVTSASAAKPSELKSAKETKTPVVDFRGKFDLYACILPFLKSEYQPSGTTTPQYKAVYEKILTYQAKRDFSMQLTLGDGENVEGEVEMVPKFGRFQSINMVNPMSEEVVEDILVTNGAISADVELDDSESAHPSTVGKGFGYEAELQLDPNCGDCMLSAGSGSIKLRKVWEEESKDRNKRPVELFEGHFTFNLRYSRLLSSRGHGSGDESDYAFWAVRALTDDIGKEIGLPGYSGL
ncbi:unnamed protein product [Somion occarium]|uniref:Uncharacterized protein n=1 Tax=Somion occarium TaxID=3059160 RepID=A0ABP1D5B7_9APHY